jgi:hypothetical protein
MDEKILAALIAILQKHESAIRRLKTVNIALLCLLREDAMKAGVSDEEFSTRIHELLSNAGQGAPPSQSVAKELLQDVDGA